MSEAFFIPHLGLGDHIICNGMIRNLIKKYDIVHMPVKKHNLINILDMVKDEPNIKLISVSGDEEAIKFKTMFEKHVDKVIGVGQYGPDFMNDSKSFDESFYKQVNMDYNERWSSFKYVRDLEKENDLFEKADLPEEYVFVHDDKSRDYGIDNSYFKDEVYVFRTSHKFGEETPTTMFHYGKIIENAKEVHCIDSSFACYIEHLICDNIHNLVLHRYIKQHKEFNTQDKNHPFFPQYRQKWEVI